MHGYLRLLPKDAEFASDKDIEIAIRSFLSGAPGVNEVCSISPHPRGGYAVTIERDEEIPESIDAYFEDSDFMFVI